MSQANQPDPPDHGPGNPPLHGREAAPSQTGHLEPAGEPAEGRERETDELLIDGQEEVFSRTEVETGQVEHHSLEEDRQEQSDTAVNDAIAAENFRVAFNPRP